VLALQKCILKVNNCQQTMQLSTHNIIEWAPANEYWITNACVYLKVPWGYLQVEYWQPAVFTFYLFRYVM